MSNHAGYASTLVVKESLLNEVLTKYHAVGTIPVELKRTETFSFSHPNIRNGEEISVTVDLDLFFSLPKLTLNEVHPSSSSYNLIEIALGFLGKVSLSCDQFNNLNFPDTTIRFKTETQVPPVIFSSEKGYRVGLDFSQVQIHSFEINVVSGSNLSSLAKWVLGERPIHPMLLT